jgi:hypothetical protein
VFLVAVALVFGAFYLYQGAQNFIRTGGLGVEEATSRAQVVSTATAQQFTAAATRVASTPRPSLTPIPECIDFRVVVNAVVRQSPSESGAVETGKTAGEIVCVLGREEGSEWYSIDLNPETRRVELAYMHEVVLEAVNPTPTPSITSTPLPTVTPAPTDTPSMTPPPTDTAAPPPTPRFTRRATPSAGQTEEATPTPVPPTDIPIQSA